MAKITSYYNLCPIHDTKDFLGLSKDRDEGNILTTLGRNIIVVIKISNQKQVRSWTVLDKLSSKVVFDPKLQQYVGVFGHKYIRCWDESTVDVNKVKKIKFNHSILDLVQSEGNETLVLFANGSCESLSSAIESRKEQSNADSSVVPTAIFDAKLFPFMNGNMLLTYFIKDEQNESVDLITVILEPEQMRAISLPKKFQIKRGDQNVKLAGYTVVDSHQFPSLLTIWSDKRLFLLNISEQTTAEDIPGNFVSMIDILKVHHPLSILDISKHCIAIYGANNGQEGASLILYNTQFKVVKAKQFFKIYFDFSRLWTIGSYILLAMGQNLSVVSFRMAKEILSELIGSQVSNEFNSYIGDDFINEEDELEENLQFNKNATNYHETSSEVHNTLRELQIADGKTIPFEPVENFNKDFKKLTQTTLHIDLFRVDKSIEDVQVNLMTNFNDDGFKTDEVDLIAKELEKCGASEHEITEKVLSVLIKSDLYQDIAVCLRRYSNVSEKLLAKTLRYALEDFEIISTDETTTNTNGSVDSMDVDISLDFKEAEEFPVLDLLLNDELRQKTTTINKRSDLVNIILSCSFDVDQISGHIRREIDFKQALLMLEHLYNLITSKKLGLEDGPDTGHYFDDDMKILQWFGLLLNTHFQKLALSKELHLIDLLLKWHEVLVNYKTDLVGMEQILSQLYNIVERKKTSTERNYSKWYSIEEVVLY